MKWSSVISEEEDFDRAVKECVERSRAELKLQPDLAVLFVSPHHARNYARIPSLIYDALKPRLMMGCSAGGVIGGGREVEQKPCLSLTTARLPDVELQGFYITNDDLPDEDARPKAWHDLMGVTPDKNPQFVLLGDPFSVDIEQYVVGIDYAFPKSAKVGGLASGAGSPGENALFMNQHVYRKGLIGAVLTGNIQIDSIVAQGCRPIGNPLMVTECQENVLMGLDNKPPMKLLEDLYETLPPRDQQLLRTSLFLGVVMDPSKTSFGQGDFLIRNIIGADPEKGILAIGAQLRQGQTVQFHLRDAKTSADDLDHLLTGYSYRQESRQAQGALLFSCMGRGAYLYGSANHDTRLFQQKVGQIPVGGFFCNGEIGPVNHTTYIHGYTSCFGIFRENQPQTQI